jgi:hypothetical protein
MAKERTSGVAGGRRGSVRRDLPVLGWREWVSLPGFEVDPIKAKIDTGARTSSLHAFRLVLHRREDGLWATFQIHPHQRSAVDSRSVEARVVEHRKVRSSNGSVQQRPVIRTDVEVGGIRWPIDITLTNRDEMGFRMLIGRAAVRRRFLVDPARSYLGGGMPGGEA